jgi:hypothetical protein
MKWEDLQVEAERIRVVAPRLVRRDGCRSYVSAPQIFDLMEEAGWIKPVVSQNRMTLFDLQDLDACIDRLKAGEFPGQPLKAAA